MSYTYFQTPALYERHVLQILVSTEVTNLRQKYGGSVSKRSATKSRARLYCSSVNTVFPMVNDICICIRGSDRLNKLMARELS